LKKYVLSDEESHVGLLLPPSAGAVLANAALGLDRRTSVNLNYSATAEVMNECIRQSDVKHVLTTRKVAEKLNVTLDAPYVYLEELREKVSLFDKLKAAWMTYVTPISSLLAKFKISQKDMDEVMTVIFTSGSTGMPKGVMLTYRNIACVIEGVNKAVVLNEDDVILGVLPFFHSFGYAVPLWTVLGSNIAGVYHFNPLDAPQIGKLCSQYGGTILLATPTFLRSYMKRVSADDFKTLSVVVAGAEKLPTELSDAFQEKYGVRPAEGYGTTELAPLVSVNQPAHRVPEGQTPKAKEGTVGVPVVHVRVKTLDLDTGEPTPVGVPGMLWVAGPNVMKGYMGRPDATAEAIVDGWYNTGDVAFIDEEGFIHITGRLSRFSKIGGEMVPHILVEQKLNEIVCEERGDMKCAVSSVPDEKKGERLVVLHTAFDMPVDELRQKLIQSGLPSIYIPGGNCFFPVDELPMLGSGKLDLKKLKDLAKDYGSQA
jgi:acyl-[acyl-carrier-protein]-phospholipid O-acyltransferase/long-chain-fatty-acid--[acyl-carrier-protein] ligase